MDMYARVCEVLANFAHISLAVAVFALSSEQASASYLYSSAVWGSNDDS